jgi:hypothetical protein
LDCLNGDLFLLRVLVFVLSFPEIGAAVEVLVCKLLGCKGFESVLSLLFRHDYVSGDCSSLACVGCCCLCFVMLFVRLVFEKWWRACRFFRFLSLEAFCRLCPFGLAVSDQFEYQV